MDSETQSYGSFVDALEAQGRIAFTSAEVALRLRRSRTAVKQGLHRLRTKKGRILGLTRDFFVIVPNEYRHVGAPPASWYIRQLAEHLGVHYYVGLLSAAEFHGAAHQRPQVFQAMISEQRPNIRKPHTRIDFHKKASVERTPFVQSKTPTGYIRVSSPEATALDLVVYYRAAGGLSRVGSLLNELAGVLHPVALRSLTDFCFRLPPLQRLGYLLDYSGHSDLTRLLHYDVRYLGPRPCALQPGRSAERSHRNEKWNIYVNTEIEVEQ